MVERGDKSVNKNKSRIAFISLMEGAPWGGSESLWFKTIKLAHMENHMVLASIAKWMPPPSSIKELKMMGIKVIERERRQNNSIIIRVVRRFLALLGIDAFNTMHNYLRRFKPDAIFINQGDSYGLLYENSLRKILDELATPYFICLHSYDEKRFLNDQERKIIVDCFQKSRRVFFVAKEQKNTIERQLAYVIDNSEIVSNPLNVQSGEIVPYPFWKKNISFAMIAVIQPQWKGHDIVFEILSSNEWRQRDLELNIYGDGEYLNYLHELTKFYKIEDKVFFHGFKSNIEEIWKHNHILLIPSRQDAAPSNLLEAMVCGRPCVGTDIGFISEYVINRETGYLAEAANARSFGQAMEEAWRNRESWEEVGRRAYLFVKDKIMAHPEVRMLHQFLQ